MTRARAFHGMATEVIFNPATHVQSELSESSYNGGTVVSRGFSECKLRIEKIKTNHISKINGTFIVTLHNTLIIISAADT